MCKVFKLWYTSNYDREITKVTRLSTHYVLKESEKMF